MMFNGKLTVTHHHRATVQEISVEMNGFSFLCLFGRHINGAYISRDFANALSRTITPMLSAKTQ